MEAEVSNPFPGLRSFEPDDDHLFFGREKQIDQLLRKLRSDRFVCVLGTSGSGKSSLVRCGLIPALHSGIMVDAGSSWRVSALRPGEGPIGNLAASLNERDVLGPEKESATTNRVLLEVILHRSTRGLIEAVREAQISRDDNLLVVVDQFEELFRYRQSCQNENLKDEALAFVKLLLEATQQDELPIHVVLTMRSDFMGDCMEYPGLPEAINAGIYLVPRMTRDELRSAITGPVAVGRGEISTRLVLRLLNDVGDDQDQLPLLQHALMRTWEHWEQGGNRNEPIDIADYEAIGTMRHALSVHAEEAYLETGSDKGHQIAERMFKALTDTFTDQRGVRRPTSVRELAAICEASEQEIIHTAEIFRRHGRCFLMPHEKVPLNSHSIIDISHESLMRCWVRLILWAEQERNSADFYMRLSKASAWFQEGIAGLWRDPELEFGLRWWVENDPTLAWAERYDGSFLEVVEFLDQSKQERDRAAAATEKERKKKLKQTQIAVAVLSVLLAVAGAFAYLAWRENTRAEGNLAEAKYAVDQMLLTAGSQTARVGADVPEMDQFRQDLLQKALVFYQDFAKQESRNKDIRAGMAEASSRLGDIYRILMKPIDAATAYEKAIEQYSSLAKDYPSEPAYRESLGYAYNFLGETLRPQPGKASDAETAYDNALQVQQKLVSESPGSAVYQQELARTYYNRGILRYDPSHSDYSEADFRQAIKLLSPLAQKGTYLSTSQELARVYNDLGNLLRQKSEGQEAAKDTKQSFINEATTVFNQAITIDQRLLKNAPDQREYKLELAQYYDDLALLQSDENDIDDAQTNNSNALKLIEDLVAPSPSLSIELANVNNIRAQIFESRAPQEARKLCQQSMDILLKLKTSLDPADLPAVQRVVRDLGYNLGDLANHNLKAGSRTDAQADLNDLSRLLPDVSDQDRPALNKYYQKLTNEVGKLK